MAKNVMVRFLTVIILWLFWWGIAIHVPWLASLPQSSVMAAERGEALATALEESINRAIQYIKRQQRDDGSWPEPVDMPCGMTGLCTLALLSAGVPSDDPAAAKALRYLRKFSTSDIDKTYSLALQTMVFCRADPARDAPRILENIRWFERTQIKDGPERGGWSYPGSSPDNSNSQFALLALYEAERVGVRASDETWSLARDYWEGGQNPDGSWGYRRGQPGTGSMTCAGIASLVIIRDVAYQPTATVDDKNRISCCGPSTQTVDRVRKGLDWLARHFTVRQNPQAGNSWLLYYLYGLERVGRLSAQRFIGQHDWYREGSAFLLELKSTVAQGGLAIDYWAGPGLENDPLLATSFALLFLAKGRRPILITKLKFGTEDNWNRHRNDVNNLAGYAEARWNMDLGWQVTDLSAATVEDLLQSPVLYLGGAESPLLGDAQQQQGLAQKIRDYVDRGGFVFAEAICPGGGFDEGFRRLISMAFPEPEYALQMLPPEHPVWSAEEPIPPEHLRPLLGVEFGCRTSVIYAPPAAKSPNQVTASLSCLWELSRAGRGVTFAPKVQSEITAGINLGLNVLAYATNRQLKYKYAFFDQQTSRSRRNDVNRNRITVAELLHPGGCHVAPRALNNLLEAAADQLQLRIELSKNQLNISDPALFDYHMAFMHGRGSFRLTDEERKQLRLYLQRGGLILADAVCASRAFTESFRREFGNLLPDHPLQPIPPDDPIFTEQYGGFDLPFVTRRDPQPSNGNGKPQEAMRRVHPELEGIRIEDRWAVIFSPYDLSCALEKQQTIGCRGYSPEDAARIGINVFLYSLQQ
ncbi:MAG: DUF4159 domain-containing protein [Thermogutta sp.]